MKVVIYVFVLFAFNCNTALCQDTNINTSQNSDISPSLKIVYPKSGSHVAAQSTFIVGHTKPNTVLTCNGTAVKVNTAGFFAQVLPLQFGANHFAVINTDTTNYAPIEHAELIINRKVPTKPISNNEFKIVPISPNANLGVRAGDVINFSAHATPNSTVYVQFGEHKLTLSPDNGKSNTSPEVTYGKVVQSSETKSKLGDLYRGTYRVSENDHFKGTCALFTLTSAEKTISADSKIVIDSVEGFLTAHTTKTPTIVRVAPDLARTTPLVEGVRINIDGWSGQNMRCFYSPNRHVWIKKHDLIFDDNTVSADITNSSQPDNPSSNSAIAKTINLVADEYGEQVRLPLPERLPFQVEQKLSPNCVVLRVYGVSSDTDWITNEPETANAVKRVIDHVTWRQTEDNVYEITVHLPGNRQWGFKTFYDQTTLCLDLKRNPVSINTEKNNRLDGIKICLDPGHGGNEAGSIGCSGMPESQLNMDIASKTRTCLENLGATVIMTRTSQNENPSLDQRVKIATDAQADFLISIHNNALPDGRDPIKEHGTSSYWYYPQAIELARCLKNAVKETTQFPDIGARYQNLALVRSTAMPSVLLEIGFMINPDEFASLIEPQFQSNIAQAIAQGIKDYIDNKKEQQL